MGKIRFHRDQITLTYSFAYVVSKCLLVYKCFPKYYIKQSYNQRIASITASLRQFS